MHLKGYIAAIGPLRNGLWRQQTPLARHIIWLYLASHGAAMFTKVSELSPQELKNSKMPIPKLYDTAVLLFKAAAAKDYAPAQNELAKIYRDGLWE